MDQKTKHKFRVSKYNLKYRKDGIYLRDEWTSMSDIGKTYNGKVFRRREYNLIENRYLSLIKKLCLLLNVTQMQVSKLEDPLHICPYINGSKLYYPDDITDAAKGCLREKYWCILESDLLTFEFGYDYYMYVSSPLDFEQAKRLVQSENLFIEKNIGRCLED